MLGKVANNLGQLWVAMDSIVSVALRSLEAYEDGGRHILWLHLVGQLAQSLAEAVGHDAVVFGVQHQQWHTDVGQLRNGVKVEQLIVDDWIDKEVVEVGQKAKVPCQRNLGDDILERGERRLEHGRLRIEPRLETIQMAQCHARSQGMAPDEYSVRLDVVVEHPAVDSVDVIGETGYGGWHIDRVAEATIIERHDMSIHFVTEYFGVAKVGLGIT